MRKVYLRILPFAVLTYFFCYLDRINVGFAALTMNKDLGLDPAMYGMAAGAMKLRSRSASGGDALPGGIELLSKRKACRS